jgi:anaerobic selenocysteine-containing dehydrogenase
MPLSKREHEKNIMKKVNTFCRACEPSCALIAEVEGDEIISLKPDKDHPVTKGFACHKGLATLEMHKDPDRLDHPLQKTAGGFEKISWDEAADGIAKKISSLTEKYGAGAIASYTGNPLAFNTTAGPAISSFLIKNQIRKNFSSGTQDCTNKFAGSEAFFGSSTIHPIPDIGNTDFLLIFGSNPRISHMSFVSIADPVAALRAAKKRGAKIRFIDPRENESIKGIGELVQVKPDTDVYLMAAMLNHLHTSGRFNDSYIREHADNIEGLIDFVSNYSPERVCGTVGISAQAIRDLAEEFEAADSAAVYMSTGVNMGRQGTIAYWLLFMLSVVTGNLDKNGGNIYSEGFYPAAKAGKAASKEIKFDPTPFGDIRKVRGSLPGNLMADMILTEENPIRGLVVISGNPLLSVGNSNRLKQAFEKLEFIIVIDIYPNATAAVADYVLPATGMYERADINLAGLGLQSQPFVQVTDLIVPPKADRKPEWWILGRIEKAQGFDSVIDDEDPDLFGRIDHMLKHSNLSMEKVQSMDHQTAVLPAPSAGHFYTDWIQTESRRVDCCPPQFEEAMALCESIFTELEGEPSTQLKMISRRTNYMLNSWFHNLDSLKRDKHLTNPIYMHPDDARARNVGDGSEVSVFNEFGNVQTIVSLDAGLKPGTVAMTHGWGHQNTGMRVAKKFAGTNANELLPSGPGSFEKLSNQSFMTGIPVEVAVA